MPLIFPCYLPAHVFAPDFQLWLVSTSVINFSLSWNWSVILCFKAATVQQNSTSCLPLMNQNSMLQISRGQMLKNMADMN